MNVENRISPKEKWNVWPKLFSKKKCCWCAHCTRKPDNFSVLVTSTESEKCSLYLSVQMNICHLNQVILSRKHHKLCFQVKWFFMKIPKWSPFFRLFALKFELRNLKNPIIDAILYVFLGILMWSKVFEVKLPCGKDVAVVLMDTQGAFDSNR